MRLGALTVAVGLAAAAPAAAAPNIVGGTPVGPGAQPSLAYVLFATHGQHFSCTGTVAAPTLVLTAAHCGMAGATTYKVVIGAPDLDDATQAEIHKVLSTAVDPDYTGAPGTDDAALLTLTTPTQAPAVQLAAPSATAASLTGSPGVLAGWGATVGGQQPVNQLMDAPTVVQSPAFCTSVYAEFDPAGQLCALDFPADDTSTCQGDSGGPLFANAPGQPAIQVGITGFQAAGCDPGSPAFFTAIAAVSPWIVGQIAAAADAPVPVTPREFRQALRAAVSATLLAQHSTVHRAARRRVSCAHATASLRSCTVTFIAGARAYAGTVVVQGQRTVTGLPQTAVSFTLRWSALACRVRPRPAGNAGCAEHRLHGHLVLPAPGSG